MLVVSSLITPVARPLQTQVVHNDGQFAMVWQRGPDKALRTSSHARDTAVRALPLPKDGVASGAIHIMKDRLSGPGAGQIQN